MTKTKATPKQVFKQDYKELCNFHRQVVTYMSWLNSHRLQTAVPDDIKDDRWVEVVADIQYGSSLRVIFPKMVDAFEKKHGIKWPHTKLGPENFYDEIESVIDLLVLSNSNAQNIIMKAATVVGPTQKVFQENGFDHHHNLYEPSSRFYDGDDMDKYAAAEAKLQEEWDTITDKQAEELFSNQQLSNSPVVKVKGS